jgi:2-dehydro-3-deoxyphosphogluconate aldolase/(4S)-4-hydroxy-2-oxoglutarate aldolase
MGRTELIAEMHRHRLVAVVRSKSDKEALETAAAVGEGGIKFIEITFSVPGAVGVIAELAKLSDLRVGGGTVLSPDEAQQAITAGAQFIVSPTLELNLVPICRGADAACISGAATPSEIVSAMRAGADLVKIFPADCVGGPHFVRQMLGPFPDVKFMVSGGVDENNVKEYFALGVTGICLGSSALRDSLVESGREGLAKYVRKFVKLVEEARG